MVILALTTCDAKIEASPVARSEAPSASGAGAATYRDPALAPEARVDDLLARMTLAEKIGQMTLVEKNSIDARAVADRFIGGVLSGGGGTPATNTPEGWASVSYDAAGRFEDAGTDPADLGIVVVGEEPYAEGVGDDPDPMLSDADMATIRGVRERSQRLIVVLVTGRPLILGDALELTDAVVVAWLPGSEGAGVADVLFGDVPFGGRLPYTWPTSLAQLPRGAGSGEPLFRYDFGLTIEH